MVLWGMFGPHWLSDAAFLLSYGLIMSNTRSLNVLVWNVKCIVILRASGIVLEIRYLKVLCDYDHSLFTGNKEGVD